MKLRRHFPNCRIESPYIDLNAHIGKHCHISPEAEVRANVQLGDYTFVNKGALLVSGTIGRYCSIAYDVKLGVPEHPVNYLSTSPFLYRNKDFVFGLPKVWDEITNPPVVGHDVWIGCNAVVLQGIHIGNGAIVAAGAVVTKDVPPYTIVGGVPAKPIKKRFTDDVIRYLQSIRWWDWPEADVRRLREWIVERSGWVKRPEVQRQLRRGEYSLLH